MKVKMQACAAISLFSLFLPPAGHAAASEGAAPATARHGMAPESHSGHGNHGGMVHEGTVAENRTGPAAWTAFPILKTRVSGEGRERRVISVIPQGIVADRVDAFSSDIKDAKGRRQLPIEMAGARLDKPEAGGFHWLAAREEQPGKVVVASTVYFFSDRGGKNPTALFMQQKHELEIIPQPFPREHSRYRANEDWKFLVRFNGTPLANQKVTLETQNGTRSELLSDAKGLVALHIPDDFKPVPQQKAAGGHDHGRHGSDFVLAIEYAEGGKSYVTAFNGSYGPDAFDQRSLAMGLGFTLLGMIGAAPLVRQRKSEKADAKRAAPGTTGEEA
jgi:hypothetical protein